MKTSKERLPQTAIELFEMLPEGLRCEVINNTIYMAPAPSFEHQEISDELTSQIRAFIKIKGLGKCVSSPVDVFLDKDNAFQPDVIFIATENLGIIQKGKVRGVPDLIIEVLSPGSRKTDLTIKRKAYEKNGVKEFFIIDPDSKKVISFLHNGKSFSKAADTKNKLISKLLKKTFIF